MIDLEVRYEGRRHFESVERNSFYARARRIERILRDAGIAFALIAHYQSGISQIIARV